MLQGDAQMKFNECEVNMASLNFEVSTNNAFWLQTIFLELTAYSIAQLLQNQLAAFFQFTLQLPNFS
jgi:hypothetical protein